MRKENGRPRRPSFRYNSGKGVRNMKKLISMLLALCLLAALGPARAEEASSQGKPYTNPNLYTEFTERPGPEENFFIYMNYDFLVQGAADIHY